MVYPALNNKILLKERIAFGEVIDEGLFLINNVGVNNSSAIYHAIYMNIGIVIYYFPFAHNFVITFYTNCMFT